MIPKFRAWDKVDRKMIDWEQMKSEFTFEYFEDTNLAFMQSTGVVDCNNRLIYEGDVIESTWWNINDERYRKRGVVDFRHGCFGIRYTEDKEGDIIQALCCAIVPKVIGNIYENPELVED